MNPLSKEFEAVPAKTHRNGQEPLFNCQPFRATKDFGGFVSRYFGSSPTVFICVWRPEWEGLWWRRPSWTTFLCSRLRLANWSEVDLRSGCAYKVRFEPPTFHEAMNAPFCLREWLAERADFHLKLE